MTTTLRRVLEAFETTDTTVRLDDLSRELGIDVGTLDNMIRYWMRRGRIREVNDLPSGCECRTCGVQSECPFIPHLPRRYEVVRSR